MSDKYVIRNCPAYCYLGKECHNKEGQYGASCCEITDCVMKQIVELCSKAHVQIIGYEKGKIYNGKNLIEANLPLTTINPLAKDILKLLDIQEVE